MQNYKIAPYWENIDKRNIQGKKIAYNENNAKLRIKNIFIFLYACLLFFSFFFQVFFVKNQYSANAGWASGQYFTNAPIFVASGTTENGQITSAKPLFTSSSINVNVVQSLLKLVNDSSVWGEKSQPTDEGSVVYLTAKDFGNYGDQSSWTEEQKGNAQILVKLLDNTSDGTNYASSASTQYWQAVYRTVTSTQDILTLYMVSWGYTSVYFDNDTSDDQVCGDYSNSNARTVVNNTYGTLKSLYSQLDNFIVAPSELPNEWQSSAYQTSQNSSSAYYNGSENDGLGASGNGGAFCIENGLDGESVAHSNWAYTINSAYNDKMWIPSAFEVLTTGYGTGSLKDTAREYDGAESISTVTSYSDVSATLDSTTISDDGRTGLWELNGFDRAIGSWAWLRSCDYDGRRVNMVINYGQSHCYQANDACYLRTAIHLDLKKLQTYITLALSSDETEDEQIVINILKQVNTDYVVIQQIALYKKEEVQSITIWFDEYTNYLLVVSKPYYWQVNYSGSGLLINDSYKFIPDTSTISISISGANGMNNSICV